MKEWVIQNAHAVAECDLTLSVYLVPLLLADPKPSRGLGTDPQEADKHNLKPEL